MNRHWLTGLRALSVLLRTEYTFFLGGIYHLLGAGLSVKCSRNKGGVQGLELRGLTLRFNSLFVVNSRLCIYIGRNNIDGLVWILTRGRLRLERCARIAGRITCIKLGFVSPVCTAVYITA